MAAVLDEALGRRRARALDLVVRRGRAQATDTERARRRRRARRAPRRAGRPGRVPRVHPRRQDQCVARRRRPRRPPHRTARARVDVQRHLLRQRPARPASWRSSTTSASSRPSGVQLYPQVSPRGVDVRVNWYGGMSFYGMADHLAPGRAGQRRREAPDAHRSRAWRRNGPATSGTAPSAPCSRTGSRNASGWSRCATRRWTPWVGRTLAELVAERGGHPSDVLADWLLENDLEPGVVGVDVTNADVEGVAAMLQHPAAIISNSDAGAHLQMMCASGDTTLLLTRHVRERGDFTLEGRGLAAHRPAGNDVRHARPRRPPARARSPTSPCSRSTSSTGTRRSSSPTCRPAGPGSAGRRGATATR